MKIMDNQNQPGGTTVPNPTPAPVGDMGGQTPPMPTPQAPTPVEEPQVPAVDQGTTVPGSTPPPATGVGQ